uniref:Uncharacterized protein n=1 Tax=Salmonella phage vB_SE130_2P TaxID=3236707 RepID=A0AB39C548_9VIRU
MQLEHAYGRLHGSGAALARSCQLAERAIVSVPLPVITALVKL